MTERRFVDVTFDCYGLLVKSMNTPAVDLEAVLRQEDFARDAETTFSWEFEFLHIAAAPMIPPRVQRSVTRLPIKMHDVLEN